MTQLDLKKYENESTLIWLINNVRLPKSLPWSFENRPWQIDIIEDQSKHITCRKPTQIGMSTIFLGKMLHFADMNTVRAMFTLPRQDDVYDMVNSRLSEIIRESPYIANRIGQINNVRMKQFGRSWLHFAEMSVEPRMMDVDWMLNDEVNLSDQEHLEQASSRMDASKFGYHHKISTPTIEGFGVDATFEQSDKKYWIVKCPYCSYEQSLRWDYNVGHTDKDGAFLMCERCKEKLSKEVVLKGKWIPFNTGKFLYSGYQINQLMVTSIDVNKMWYDFQTMSAKNFHNYRLGLPYTPTSGAITHEMLRDNCYFSEHRMQQAASRDDVYILGADQGDDIHVVVAKMNKNNGGLEIVYANKLSFEEGFDELKRIVKTFNVSFGILDALPNHHTATKTAESLKGRIKIGYFTTTDRIYTEKEEYKVNINKTDGYDLVVEYIATGKLQFPVKNANSSVLINTISDHLTNMRRDIVTSKTRSGGEITSHVWKAVGPDHYADAVLYTVLAADMLRNKNESLTVLDTSKINEFLESVGAEHLIERADNEIIPLTPNLAPTNPYTMRKRI